MSLDRDLEKALLEFQRRKVTTFIAEVVAVNKQNGTCIVTDEDLEYKVRLASVINNDKQKFYLFPLIGSMVLVSPIEEDIRQLYIDKYSEIEEFNFKVADCEFSIDNKGINFKKNDDSLRSLVLELITTIRNMKFTTNTGATIKLINEADFLELENKFKNLLKPL